MQARGSVWELGLEPWLMGQGLEEYVRKRHEWRRRRTRS